MAASPGRAASRNGGSGRIANSAASDAMNETTSTAYAPAIPTVAIRMPPAAGPTMEAVWKLSWLSAIAAGSRSFGTSRGIAEARVGWSTAPRPAATNATPNRAGSAGWPSEREDRQRQAARRQPGLGDHQQPAAIDGVGQRSGAEREQQDRDQLEERQRADRQRRPGQDVDLERQGHPGDLVADPRDDLARPQPAKVAVAPDGRDVEEESSKAGHPA